MKNTKPSILVFFKILILSLLFTFPYSLASGQKNVKYKDVYKAITEKSKEEAYSMLLVFQKQEPFSANTYLQLGLLSQFWSKDYDALTNLQDVEFFIYNTNLYFGLALSKVEQKEIRRNDKYYLNIDRFKNVEDLDVEAVKIFIQEQIDANNEYKKNVKIVTNYFNSSILHYSNCIKLFKEINTDNNKIKDIYLTANNDLIARLNELEKSFDSTIFYLQNYQTAVKNYPIKKYNQKYKLMPIETYRLQGLTGSDFLQDEIPIWDYGTWVKSVKQIINTNIKDLRVQIISADKQLNQDISMLQESKEFKTDFAVQKVDDKLKFKISKFDHKSILLSFFKYKENKLDFLIADKDPINNPNDTASGYSYIQKSRYYESLIEKKFKCDSLNENFVKDLNAYELNKYNDFFSETYGGESGLKTFSKMEKLFLNQTLLNSVNNYKSFYFTAEKQKLNPDTLLYKNSKIPLSKSVIGKLENGKYYTTDIQKNNFGDYYLTGIVKENNKASAFVARTNKLENIKWLQLISADKQEIMSGIGIYAKDDGCEVLINLSDTPNIKNQIVFFDQEGKQKEKIELGVQAFPRYFSYDEINQKYLLVFKGASRNQFNCLNDELLICQYDGITKQETWRSKLKLNGLFVDVLKFDQDLILINNFTQYKNEDKYIWSDAGGAPESSNALMVVLDENGKIKNEVPLLNNKPFQILKAIKISSSRINLIGFKGQMQDPQFLQKFENEPLLFLMVDGTGKLIFNNWN